MYRLPGPCRVVSAVAEELTVDIAGLVRGGEDLVNQATRLDTAARLFSYMQARNAAKTPRRATMWQRTVAGQATAAPIRWWPPTLPRRRVR